MSEACMSEHDDDMIQLGPKFVVDNPRLVTAPNGAKLIQWQVKPVPAHTAAAALAENPAGTLRHCHVIGHPYGDDDERLGTIESHDAETARVRFFDGSEWPNNPHPLSFLFLI
jgi:hypothetical protein